MDLTFLPKVEIRSSEVTAGRLSYHTLLRNCPYPVLRKLSAHKMLPPTPTPTVIGQARPPLALTISAFFQGRLMQTRKSGYFPSVSVKPCPVDGRVSACTEASGAQWLGCQGCRVPRAVPSLGMSLLMAIVSLPQSRGCAPKEDGWGPRCPPVCRTRPGGAASHPGVKNTKTAISAAVVID